MITRKSIDQCLKLLNTLSDELQKGTYFVITPIRKRKKITLLREKSVYFSVYSRKYINLEISF